MVLCLAFKRFGYGSTLVFGSGLGPRCLRALAVMDLIIHTIFRRLLAQRCGGN
jgi:hypothetical protein